jgi:hypothetical protein
MSLRKRIAGHPAFALFAKGRVPHPSRSLRRVGGTLYMTKPRPSITYF